MSIILIDSDWDPATSTCAKLRREKYLKESLFPNHVFTSARGSMATMHSVQRKLDDEVVYVSAQGHGRPSLFTGDGGDSIFRASEENSLTKLSSKIVHLLSCFTAAELGIEMVSKGVLAFFGYEKDFRFARSKSLASNPLEDEIASLFIDIASEVDRMVLSGASASEVHARVTSRYESAITEQTMLNQDVAARLNHDFRYFRSPVVDSAWGDVNARLTSIARPDIEAIDESQPVLFNVSENDWARPAGIDVDGNVVNLNEIYSLAKEGKIKPTNSLTISERRELAARRIETRSSGWIEGRLSPQDNELISSVRGGGSEDEVDMEVSFTERLLTPIVSGTHRPVSFRKSELDRPVTLSTQGDLVSLSEYRTSMQNNNALSLDALDDSQTSKLILGRLEHWNDDIEDAYLTEEGIKYRGKQELMDHVVNNTDEGKKLISMERLYVGKLLSKVDNSEVIV